MNLISDGCRLCLDPFAERFATIDSQVLKGQMEKVFCFSIEPKQGYCSDVCQICSYTISEFYQYSEKVRQNQEVLNGIVTNCDSTIDSKISIECVKHETLSDPEPPVNTEDACELENLAFEEEEVPVSGSKITLQRVKVETLNDSELLENWKPENQTLGDEEVPFLDSQISLENFKIETLSDSELPETTQTTGRTIRTAQDLHEEDQLFKKHLRMVCDLCGMVADSFPALCSHFKKEHNRRHGYVVCCNKKLFRRCNVREHIGFHTDPAVFRCQVCAMPCKSVVILNKHMLKRHSCDGRHPFKCDQCSKSFPEKSGLTEHMTRHMKVECPKCNKLISKGNLKSHISKMHTGKERPMFCNTCDKRFLNMECFKDHMKVHMGIEVQKVQCKMCQRWLKGTKSLRNHILRSHRSQEVQCDLCLKKFKNPQFLYTHKIWTHGEPKYECEYCGKKFKVSYRLKEHRATHTGEVVNCEYCGVSTTSKSHLYRHIKRHHPVELAQKKLIEDKKNCTS